MIETITPADFNAGRHLRKRHKYGAKAVVVDGIRFPSMAEAKRDGELLLLERAGKIADLKRQPKFDLVVNGKKVCGYRGDWSYTENGVHVVEDRKGAITPAFKIKWALANIEWRLS